MPTVGSITELGREGGQQAPRRYRAVHYLVRAIPVALPATAGALTSCADAQRVTSVMHPERTPETLNVGRVKIRRSPGTVDITFMMYDHANFSTEPGSLEP